MQTIFDDACCARVPRAAVAELARLRVEPGLRAAFCGDHTWLRWDAGHESIVKAVMPIHGVVLYRRGDQGWHRCGLALPDFEVPDNLEYQSLANLLFPAPVQPIPATDAHTAPVMPMLDRDDQPRATTAVLCSARALLAWSDTVPIARLGALKACGLGSLVLLVGKEVPPIDDGERLWGRDVLVPLGYMPVPALPESAFKEVAGATVDEMVLWRAAGVEVIPRSRLTPLTRAAVRLFATSARAELAEFDP